jgi:hypothetical protein
VVLVLLHPQTTNYRGRPVFHLIYTSKERPESSPLNLKKILVNARMRNSSAGVSGVLIHHQGAFLQALEGPESAVRNIFARIEKDVRHVDISVLNSAPTVGQRRKFGDWSMGFHDATGSAHLLKGFIALENDLALTDLSAIEAMNLLESCCKNDPPQLPRPMVAMSPIAHT